MQERVEEFLENCRNEKSAAEKSYRYFVMKRANLLSEKWDYAEVTKAEYDNVSKTESDQKKEENGKYYIYRKQPIEISEEEFAAVEKAIPEDILNDMKRRAAGIRKEKNVAVIVFIVLACILWIGGLILAINESLSFTGVTINSRRIYDFSFGTFMNNFLYYLPRGAVCFLFAVLCKKFHMSVDLRRKK